jgi:hypothetical protein
VLIAPAGNEADSSSPAVATPQIAAAANEAGNRAGGDTPNRGKGLTQLVCFSAILNDVSRVRNWPQPEQVLNSNGADLCDPRTSRVVEIAGRNVGNTACQ